VKTNGSVFSNQKFWIILLAGLFLLPYLFLMDHPQQGVGVTLALAVIISLAIFFDLSIPILLLMATFFSDLYLGDIEIGPVSLRVYLILLLFLFVCTESLFSGKGIFRTNVGLKLFAIYSLFALWTVVNNYYLSESITKVLYKFSSTHLLGILYFLVIQSILRKKKRFRTDNMVLHWCSVFFRFRVNNAMV